MVGSSRDVFEVRDLLLARPLGQARMARLCSGIAIS
jgi:hypothetical protein